MIALFDIDGVLNQFHFPDYTKIGLDTEQMQEFWSNEFKECLVGEADTKEVLKPYSQQWGFKSHHRRLSPILARKWT